MAQPAPASTASSTLRRAPPEKRVNIGSPDQALPYPTDLPNGSPLQCQPRCFVIVHTDWKILECAPNCLTMPLLPGQCKTLTTEEKQQQLRSCKWAVFSRWGTQSAHGMIEAHFTVQQPWTFHHSRAHLEQNLRSAMQAAQRQPRNQTAQEQH